MDHYSGFDLRDTFFCEHIFLWKKRKLFNKRSKYKAGLKSLGRGDEQQFGEIPVCRRRRYSVDHFNDDVFLLVQVYLVDCRFSGIRLSQRKNRINY